MTQLAGRSGDAAPIIVSALLAPGDFDFFNRLRRAHFPPERNVLDAHLTLFHHLPPGAAPEIARALAQETRGVSPPRALASGVISLGRGVAFRILSAELDAVRGRLAARFAGQLTPQDAVPWRAHITVQNKVAPEAARALRAALAADFSPRPVALSGLAAWWYRGGPWELLARHRFG